MGAGGPVRVAGRQHGQPHPPARPRPDHLLLVPRPHPGRPGHRARPACTGSAACRRATAARASWPRIDVTSAARPDPAVTAGPVIGTGASPPTRRRWSAPSASSCGRLGGTPPRRQRDHRPPHQRVGAELPARPGGHRAQPDGDHLGRLARRTAAARTGGPRTRPDRADRDVDPHGDRPGHHRHLPATGNVHHPALTSRPEQPAAGRRPAPRQSVSSGSARRPAVAASAVARPAARSTTAAR